MKPKKTDIEPAGTIDWAAYHLFSPEFHHCYRNDYLNDVELYMLISVTLAHVQKRSRERFFLEFRLKRYDRKVISLLWDVLNHSLGEYLNSRKQIHKKFISNE